MSASNKFLSVAEAHSLVFENAEPLGQREAALSEALGLVLAADAVSDVDSPPHDKSVVDGYALRSEDLGKSINELSVLEEVTAGRMPTREIISGTCIRIMTGAAVPASADAVVMFEKTDALEGDRVRIQDPNCSPGQNILRQGTSLRRGEVVVSRGTLLRPIHVGLLAEVGRPCVSVFERPQVAILATGDELVPIDQTPGPAQIRNSNGDMLAALTTQAGAAPMALGIARDEPSELRAAILRRLDSDILLLSGGVSAGVLDLVPATLCEIGVREVFHKVKVKPGKPLWFGVYERDGLRCLVFGLPGNPLSGLVSFELFVRPALAILAGGEPTLPRTIRATLTESFNQRGDRQTYFPALLSLDTTPAQIAPVPWSGSADMRGFATANALAIFPPGEHRYEPGEEICVLPLSPPAY